MLHLLLCLALVPVALIGLWIAFVVFVRIILPLMLIGALIIATLVGGYWALNGGSFQAPKKVAAQTSAHDASWARGVHCDKPHGEMCK